MGLTGRLRRLEGEVEEIDEEGENEERHEEEKEHEEEEQKVNIEERHGENLGVEEKVHHHIERKQKEENKGRIKEMREEGRKGLGEEWRKVEKVHHDRKSLKMSGKVLKEEKGDAK